MINKRFFQYISIDIKRNGGDCARIYSDALLSLMCRFPSIYQKWLGMTPRLQWYTLVHSYKVTKYSCMMGYALGLSPRKINNLAVAALLHDIGKAQISLELLKKPHRLTEEEYTIIKQHPRSGEQLLRNTPGLRSIIDIVLHHHERFDGKGYPHKISGTSIPLKARIISVADSFEAMTARRPYKPRMRAGEAMAELIRCSGSQFDPNLVDVFINKLQKTNLICAAH